MLLSATLFLAGNRVRGWISPLLARLYLPFGTPIVICNRKKIRRKTPS